MLSLAFMIAAASVAEQMEPARHGKLQCQMPDALFKTCLSLSKVVQTGPSTYGFETQMLVDAKGPVIVTLRSTATVRGQEVCDRGDAYDWSGADVTVAGKTLPAASAARRLSSFRRAFTALQGTEICTQIVSTGDGMEKVIGRVAGKRMPAVDYDMIWVDPDEGWEVGR